MASHPEPIAFLLWGAHAQAKTHLITDRRHVIVPSPHPMARLRLGSGFAGSKPFSQANDGLRARRADPIDWSLDD